MSSYKGHAEGTYYAKNRERILAERRDYHVANRDALNAGRSRRYWADREGTLARAKEFRASRDGIVSGCYNGMLSQVGWSGAFDRLELGYWVDEHVEFDRLFDEWDGVDEDMKPTIVLRDWNVGYVLSNLVICTRGISVDMSARDGDAVEMVNLGGDVIVYRSVAACEAAVGVTVWMIRKACSSGEIVDGVRFRYVDID